MASVTKNTTLYCNQFASNSWRLTATLTENSVGTSSQNTSNITITATLTSIAGSFATSANNTLEIIYYDNNDYSNGHSKSIVVGSLNAQASTNVTETFNVSHKPDGSLSGYVIAKWTKASSSGYPPNDGSVQTSSLTFTKIARYANITAFSVSKRNSNSFTGTFTTDATVDKAEYRVKTSSASSYGSWTDAGITAGTSKTIKIGGSLSANTTYNIQLRVRRQDSQLTTDSSVVNQTTYKLPTQTLSTKTETTAKINWTSDTTASTLWYSKDNGQNWTQTSPSATSGSFTLTGLTPNNTYNVKTKILRSGLSSGNEDTSTALAVTTYKDAVFSLKSKTETSFTFNWSADSKLSKIEYRYKLSTASSYPSSWTDAHITAGTSGTLSISGLTANKEYNIQFKTTRNATTTETRIVATVQTQKTYNYPYVKSASSPNLTAGNSQTLTIYNPLGRSVTIYMKKDSTSGTQLYSGTSSTAGESASYSFTPTKANLYNSVTNAKSGNAVYYCVYSSQTVSTVNGTYLFGETNSDLTPTLATTEWSYIANQTNLTNNNQVVIKDNSTIQVSVTTSASNFKYNAGIKSIKVECGTKSNILTTSTTTGTNTVSVANVDGNIIKVTLTDTRGYEVVSQLNISSNFIDYYKPEVNVKTTHRESGVGTDTTLTLEGKVFYDNFSSSGILNQFISAKYYTSTDNSTWSSAFDIPVSNFTYQYKSNDKDIYELTDFQIHANGTSGGFVVGQRYYIKVVLQDNLQTLTITGITVTDGKIAIDVYQDNDGEYHRGVNGLAKSDYALTVYGNINPAGGQLIRSSGGTFIKDREYAPVRNNNASSSSVYNPVISSKTKNGNWTIGNYNSDNLYFNYSTDENYNDNINETTVYTISTDGLFSGYSRYVYHLLTNPNSAVSYFIPFIDGIENAEKYSVRGNDGIRYNCVQGSTSTEGWAIEILGNSKATETAGNKTGEIRLFGDKTYYSQIRPKPALTNNRTLFMPNIGGDIAVRVTDLYNNSSGTTSTITLSASVGNYNSIVIYYGYGSNNYRTSVKVKSANNRRVVMTLPISSSSYIYTLVSWVTVSGTSITWGDNREYIINNSTGAVTVDTTRQMYIYKVDGCLD